MAGLARRSGLFPVVAAVAALASAAPALADDAHAAIVVSEGAAQLLDANKRPFPVSDYHKVTTQSANRNVILKLLAKGAPNPTGEAVHWDYATTRMWCKVWVARYGYVWSKDWRQTISAKGNTVLTCCIKLPQ